MARHASTVDELGLLADGLSIATVVVYLRQDETVEREVRVFQTTILVTENQIGVVELMETIFDLFTKTKHVSDVVNITVL